MSLKRNDEDENNLEVTPELEEDSVTPEESSEPNKSMAVFRHEWPNGASIECTCPEEQVDTIKPEVMFKLEFEGFGDKILKPLIDAFQKFISSKSIYTDSLGICDLVTFTFNDDYLRGYSVRYCYPMPKIEFKYLRRSNGVKEVVSTGRTNLVQGVLDMYVDFINSWVKTHNPLY